jgi:hypothetical protein
MTDTAQLEDGVVGAALVAKGIEYLGQGVNIFQQGYLETPSHGRMLNITEKDVTKIRINKTNLTETYGSNFAEFLQEFSVEAGLEGSYGGFSASVEAMFSNAQRTSIDIRFAQLALVVSGAKLNLSRDKVVLRGLLNPEFKRALDNDDPQDLFNAYGTHVAVALRIGGMLTYYSYSKATEHQTEKDFKLAAQAKYKGFGATVGANAALTEKEKEAAKTVEGSTHLWVNGGEAGASARVRNDDKGSYGDWAKTLEGDPGFIGFEVNGLLPVWDLTADRTRAAALNLGFRQEAARQFQIRIFTHTGLHAGHPEARVRIPAEYKLISGGARDNWAGRGNGNLLTASAPLNTMPRDDITWMGRGKDHHDVSPATISVFALGIYDNLNIWEVKQFEANSSPGPHPSAEVTLSTEFVAQGGVLVGGGADVGGNKLLTSCYPKDKTTWAANATDPWNPGPGAMAVFAVGLRCTVKDVVIAIDINRLTSRPANHPSETCSPGRDLVMTGGGALVDYATGPGNFLTSTYPENDQTWKVSSKDHGRESIATITAYAIGLKVSIKPPKPPGVAMVK